MSIKSAKLLAVCRALQLISLLLLLAPALTSAKIYKWVHPDGSVSYSDRAQEPDAKPVELPPLQTFSPPAISSEPTPSAGQAEDAGYESVRIMSPKPDETIRDNGGTVSVQIEIKPALQSGHTVEVLLDGKSVGSGTATSMIVSNMDRGTHSISAAVKDSEGTVLTSSAGVSFTLQRTSQKRPAHLPARPRPRPAS